MGTAHSSSKDEVDWTGLADSEKEAIQSLWQRLLGTSGDGKNSLNNEEFKVSLKEIVIIWSLRMTIVS